MFLAVGAAAGLALGIEQTAGQTLVIYSLLSMLLAALVLISSRRKLIIPALIQGVPPLLGLLFLA